MKSTQICLGRTWTIGKINGEFEKRVKITKENYIQNHSIAHQKSKKKYLASPKGKIYQYNNNNSEKGKARDQKYKEINRKEINLKSNERCRKQNYIRQKRWQKNNPERVKEIQKKFSKTIKAKIIRKRYWSSDKGKKLQKKSNLFRTIRLAKKFADIDPRIMNLLLRSWSILVKERDKGCVICGIKNENSIAHHILYKSKYPQLALNLNNGMELCRNHSKELHSFDERGG